MYRLQLPEICDCAATYVCIYVTVPPWPPGRPQLVPGPADAQADVVTIRWDPPPDDGGAPITGSSENVAEFKHLGAIPPKQNYIHEEMNGA